MDKLAFKEFFESVEQQEVSDFEVAHLYASNTGMKIKELATNTGRSIGEIYRIIRKYGMGPNRQMKNHTNVIALAEDPHMSPATYIPNSGIFL